MRHSSSTCRRASTTTTSPMHSICRIHRQMPRRSFHSAGDGARDVGPRSMPRVTVIMATYNWATVLPYSIGSVLAQTFTDFELLVMGDGCTDDSGRVVASIRDRRVHWCDLAPRAGHQSGPNN